MVIKGRGIPFLIRALLVSTALSAAMAMPGRVAARGAERRPNIIILLADDLGFCDLRRDQCGEIPIPNIHSIAAAGVLFTDSYATSPSCSPSRAALLTGRYQQRLGVEFNVPTGSHEHGLPRSGVTLAGALSQRGYETGIIGKWHLGLAPKYLPLNRGFGYFFGFAGARHPYFPRGKSRLIHQKSRARHTQYLADEFSREAVSFIRRNRDHPYLLYMAFNLPHAPQEAHRRHLKRFQSISVKDRRVYSAMVSALDDAVGAILTELKTSGAFQNTLVFFLNDNGCGPSGTMCTNSPFRGGKFLPFEGGIRVPFALQWPAEIPAGTVYRYPVSSLDVFPTAVEASGQSLRDGEKLDGVNLIPYVLGERAKPPHEMLFWRNGDNKAVRRGDWKLVDAGEREWLFDLSTDISESKDVSEGHPAIVKELKQALSEWEAGLSPPAWPSSEVHERTLGDGESLSVFP